MARLYSDENFPVPVVEILRELGHDVLTCQEAGKASRAIPDDEVLQFACSGTRAVLTTNRRHFFRLHENNPNHCGIVACTQNLDVKGFAELIHAKVQNEEPLDGKVLRVYRPSR